MVWTKEEKKYLKENYKTMFYSDIAEHLNKTHCSVRKMAFRVGLKSGNRGRPKYQDGENNGNWKGGISKNNYHYKKIAKQRHPKKVRAREAVFSALRSGKLHKPNHCEDCKKRFSKNKIEGHHEDYDKPLEVIWLCRKCHRKLHRKLNSA